MRPRQEPRTRSATTADAAACQAVYAPYVQDTVISFEEQVPDVAEMRRRIEDCLRSHAWVVLEVPDADTGTRVAGYAYGGPHKTRAAYRWATEVSVYLEPGLRRTGGGRMLYTDLFARLAQRGYLMALAGMTLPNPASEGLHRALGFEDVGTWRRIGWKHGAWHDTYWMQRPLPSPVTPPAGAPEGPPADPS